MSQTNSSDTRAKIMEHLITLDSISTKMLNDFQKKNELLSSLNKIDTHHHISMAGGGNRQAMPQKKSLDSNSFSLSSISTVSTSTERPSSSSKSSASARHSQNESGSATSTSKTLSTKTRSAKSPSTKSHTSKSHTDQSDSAVISSTSSNDRFHGGTFTKDMIDSEGFDLKCGKPGLKRK